MGRILATAPERAAKVTVARLIIAQQTGGIRRDSHLAPCFSRSSFLAAILITPALRPSVPFPLERGALGPR